MASSTNKGNISTLMAVIAFCAIIVFVGIVAELMLTDGVRAGKYNNPNVATQVMRGSIYDRNGRALALEVPVNNLYLKTSTTEADLISQILSTIIDVTPSEVLSVLSKSTDKEVLVYKDLKPEEVQRLTEEFEKNSVASDVDIRKEYIRTYPAAFHAAQLVAETEDTMFSILSPNPGYDEHTTYGNDVYLTIDIDIQYLLDLAVQQVYEIQQPDYAIAFILDIKTGELLASTNYPFFDLNEIAVQDSHIVNRTLVSSITRPDVRITEVKVIEKVEKHGGASTVDDYSMDQDYTKDLMDTVNMVRFPDGYTSLVAKLPEEHPQYLIFIGSQNPKYYQVSSVLEYAIESLEQGLEAQGKILK